MATPARHGVVLDGRHLSLAQLEQLAEGTESASIDADARTRVVRSWAASRAIATNRPVYGRTTGVGANKSVELAVEKDVEENAEQDYRLVRGCASGFGPWVSDTLVRGMLAIRVNQMLAGGSGVHVDVVDAFAGCLAAPALPMVHAYGSIGTGDLSALCETVLCLIGDNPSHDGRTDPRLVLHPGDGLPIMESNALMLATGALACQELSRLVRASLIVATMSLLAVRGSAEPFDERVHAARPHPGQRDVAASIRCLLHGVTMEPARIQDSYGFRALPQVMGPVVDSLLATQTALTIDINAAAENPLVSAAAGDVFHNANFHAAPIAIALDHLRIALTQAAQLSQSRLCALSEPQITGLPAFLATGTLGSNGIMMLEYDATAAVAQLRAGAYPASLGHAVISRGTEDHASFAAQAAQQTQDAAVAYRRVIACELTAAVRALRLGRRQPEPDTPIGRHFATADLALDTRTTDRALSADIQTATELLDILV